MRLKYRGNGYDLDPVAVDMGEFDTMGTYRGQNCRFAYPRHIPVPQTVSDLRYRGIAYHKTETGAVEAIAPVRRGRSESTQTLVNPRRTLMQEVERIHRDNIERRLQHRLEVAQARGDQDLIHALEREMQEIV